MDGSYTMRWGAVRSSKATQTITFFLVEADNSDFKSPVLVYSGPNTSHIVNGKVAGHYYYRVKGCNQRMCSGWSVESVAAWWENEPNNEYPQASGPLLPAIVPRHRALGTIALYSAHLAANRQSGNDPYPSKNGNLNAPAVRPCRP
jgi:hypothetical protein